jgi:hypothetical protein
LGIWIPTRLEVGIERLFGEKGPGGKKRNACAIKDSERRSVHGRFEKIFSCEYIGTVF